MKRLFTIVYILCALTANAQIDSYQGIGSFLFLGDKVGAPETDTTNNVFETRRLLVNDTTNFPERRTLLEWGPTITQIAAFNSDNQCFNSGTGAFEWTGVDDGQRIRLDAENNLLTFEVKGIGGSNSIEMQDGITTLTDIMRYGSDLSAGYTARSLVDKGYVDALINVAGSDGQIIYNNAGAYAGNAAYTVNPTNYLFTVTGNSAATNTAQNRLVLATNSTGTPAVGLGGVLLFQGETSTTENRDIASIAGVWGSVTDASRQGALVFSTAAVGGTMGERARITTDGRLGIGTNSPFATLTNASSAFGDGSINVSSLGIGWTILGPNNYAAGFRNTNSSGHGLFTGTAGSTSSQIAFRASRNTSTATFSVLGNGRIDTEGLRLFFSTTTQETNYVQANSSGTNVNVGLIPKGTGAIVADIPDATSAGGNARGQQALDLQFNRSAATEVASGTESAIVSGQQNTASGTRATAIGAFQSTASGQYAWVQGNANTASADYTSAIGNGALAADYGQEARSSGTLSAAGDAQVSRMVMRNAITGTGSADLFANGTNQRCRVPIGRAFNFAVQVVATCKTVGNGVGISTAETFVGSYVGGIKNNGGETALVGTVQSLFTAQADTGMSTSAVAITADNTNDALTISFTPPSTAGSTTVINVVATVTYTQVGF